MSAGYDPFKWYEQELDLEHEAWLAGYDDVDEYHRHEEDLKADTEIEQGEERRINELFNRE